MRLAKHQAGIGFIGWMFILIVLGFLSMFAIKVIPAYLENFTIRSVLQSFKTDTTIYSSAQDVKIAIGRRFSINNINNITPGDVLVEPIPGGYLLRADYEVRVPFVSNISIVTSFSESAEARGSSELAQ